MRMRMRTPMRMRMAQVEQEVYLQAEIPYSNHFNQLNRNLGPLQLVLHELLIRVRIASRALTWDDRALSFFATALVSLLLVVCVGVAELLMLVPWGLVFEWSFRLLGAAALGPHMALVGRRFRREARAWQAKRQQFADASKGEQRAILAAHRAEMVEEARARLRAETGEDEPDDDETAALGKSFHLLVTSRPNVGTLRYRFAPDVDRSHAYPALPAEDRPALDC